MTNPVEQAASGGMGYAASGTALGTVGFAWADQWPVILQFANLGLVVVSIAVGVVTLAEKVRRWNKDTREEREHEAHDRETRRIQRATLRALGVPVDTDPSPLDDPQEHHRGK